MSLTTVRHCMRPQSFLLRTSLAGVLLLASFVSVAKDFEVTEATVAEVHAAYKAHTLTAHQLVAKRH